MIVVVGGGPAGLAAAAALGRAGQPAVVLEQGDAGAAWRGRYDRLRLNTSKLTSRLPHLRYADGVGLFPTRDEFVAHLERFVAQEGIELRTGTRVERIDPGWTVRTAGGDVAADHVIVATGYANRPYLPPWPGRDAYERPLLHSAEYRNPEPFRGADVLVVGPGSSGMEIAYDLAEGGAGRVRLAVRTPPNIVLRKIGGLPGDPVGLALARLPPRLADAPDPLLRRLMVGDLRPYGLPRPREPMFARLRRLGVGPAVVDPEVIDAIRARRIEVVHGVEALDATGARLAGGGRIAADAIVAATGYRCGLEPLVGHLGVLDDRGAPLVVGGREAAPGLRFVGYVPIPGQIRQVRAEARRAAREISAGRARSWPGRRRPPRPAPAPPRRSGTAG